MKGLITMSHNCGNCEHSHHACGCGCGAHGCESEQKTRVPKPVRIAAAFALFLAGFFTKGSAGRILFVSAYCIAGYDVLFSAVKNIFRGELFDENFLMAAASLGALCLRDFAEAPAVMLFYQIGEALQDYAFEKSEKSVKSIMNIRPEHAYLSKNGKRIEAEASEVPVGEIISVAPGERVPLDGHIVSGSCYMDTSCITGESVKRKFSAGDEVLSGYVNFDGIVEIKVSRPLSDSAASRIIELMKNSLEKKSRSEKFITKFAKIYTPAVVALAFLTAVVPPLFDGMNFAKWIGRALTFLVISCPCALVISIPLGFFAGLGAASKSGIVIKGGNALEKLAEVKTIIFDKTGTLTKGVFEITDIQSSLDKTELLRLLAHAEYYSNHPVAAAIRQGFDGELDPALISDYREIAGKGVSVKISEDTFLAGNAKLMEEFNVTHARTAGENTVIYVARNGQYIGYVSVGDKIRDLSIIKELNESGIKTVMLTGDGKQAAEYVGKTLGISEIRSELLPGDKLKAVEKIAENSTCAFVGDGINDAPALAAADVGIAPGGIGSDAAVEAADVILINDDITKIKRAMTISRKTMKIVRENIVLSIGIKLLIMLLEFFGIGSMWLAIFADVGVALIAILNSMRALKA